ncbi:PEP-utilizing enzyme [Nanoarchaeota archaeon]
MGDSIKYILGNQDVDSSLITLEMTWRGIGDKRVKDQAGVLPLKSLLEIVKGKTINYYVDHQQFKPFADGCARALLNKKGLLEELEQGTVEISKKIRDVAISNIDKISGMSDKELACLLREVKNLQAECAFLGTVVAFADIFGEITNNLVEVLKRRENLKHKLHVYTGVLGNPSEKSLTEEAYEKITEDSLKEYFWLDQGYIGRGLTKEQLEGLSKKEEEQLPSSDELLDELNLSEEEQNLFRVSRGVIKIKSLRADSRQFLHVVTNRIVDLLSSKWDVKPEYLETLYAEEICGILEGNSQVPKNLEERWKHSVLIWDLDTEYQLLVGDDADTYLKERLIKEEIEDKEVIKGQPACPGKVKGIVKIVFTPQHNSKVQEGDILVSRATSPQLLPAMKKAAAFVTDVGGVTSHAAIVSRELNKPCVVGTRYITELVKDGDIIEVDADNGVVKIIK